MRGGENGEPSAKKRRTGIDVTQGKSVSLEDLSVSPSPSVIFCDPFTNQRSTTKETDFRPRSPASNASTSTSSTLCCKRNRLSVPDHQHPMLLQVQVLLPAAKETVYPPPINSIQCFYKYKFYSLLQKKQFIRPRSPA
ncbi:hypothetical protein ElyMa_003586100 [Elysia marginata]|uniref:Uncharacterized protein n=1 Tax=Elysia marginata TaxID=1093978 RepID=A0AAV4ENB9_9GAST|nr:hypothetical protein ElyMa_003586100 [Elysia marginata]